MLGDKLYSRASSYERIGRAEDERKRLEQQKILDMIPVHAEVCFKKVVDFFEKLTPQELYRGTGSVVVYTHHPTTLTIKYCRGVQNYSEWCRHTMPDYIEFKRLVIEKASKEGLKAFPSTDGGYYFSCIRFEYDHPK